MSKPKEVEWGESQEHRVLGRWLDARTDRTSLRCLKSRDFQDWDFFVLDGVGLPALYVEIKVRRSKFARFGDAISPIRKHHFAVKLAARHNIPFLMIVEHPDALISCDLTQVPHFTRFIERTDRPGQGADHGIWDKDQIEVLA